MGCEFSEPNALKFHQLLAPLLPLPQSLLTVSPLPLPFSQNPPALAPFSKRPGPFHFFGNFAPAACMVPFLGPIPAGLGGVGRWVCLLLFRSPQRELEAWGCGSRLWGPVSKRTTSPGTGFIGCRLSCPQSQNCSYLLKLKQRCVEWHLLQGSARGWAGSR